MQLPSIAEQWFDKFKDYWADKKPNVTTYRCCISLFNNHLNLVYINKRGSEIELLFSDILHLDNLESLPLVLSGIVKKHGLETIPIYWLLAPSDYQLLIMDALPVPKEEFRDALSWRMRNLISYPISEAIIDSFNLPAQKSSPDAGMVGAIAARAKPLSQIVSILENINLKLKVIDIPELAMRNLTALYEEDEKSTAFIYFFEGTAILNITCKKTLYFTRRIELRFEEKLAPEEYEKLSLEILRYFDYFQSQWRYPAPGRIFISAQKGDTNDMARSLSTYLLSTVEPFSLKNVIANKTQLSQIEKNCLLQFGCALRENNDV